MNSTVRVCVGMAIWVPSGRCSWVVGCCERTLVCFASLPLLLPTVLQFVLSFCHLALANSDLQLSAMDVSVRSTMKGAAKCDKHCELQNSVNRQGLERILCFWDIPESMPASVSMLCCSSCCAQHCWASFCEYLCLRMCSGTLEASDS